MFVLSKFVVKINTGIVRLDDVMSMSDFTHTIFRPFLQSLVLLETVKYRF